MDEKLKIWNIHDIESMDENTALQMACETMRIKGHDIYFVDFGGYFGYSCLVFKDAHHVHYANDYQIHHNGPWPECAPFPREKLREIYIRNMNHTLYTEAEILGPLKDYDDYERKSYFLRNYYPMRRDYLSVFSLPKERETQEYKEKSAAMTVFDPVAYAFFRPEDADFVEHHKELNDALEASWKAMSGNYEYQKKAFLKEMDNHEYGINWQADYDTLSAFGNITYWDGDDDLQHYFDELGFNDVQRRAYIDARKQYFREHRDF